jgi:hypothetical protein
MVLLIVAMVAGATWLHTYPEKTAWVLGSLTALLLIVAQAALMIRRYRPLPGGLFLGPVRYDFDAGGMRSTRPNSEGAVRWAQIQAVDATPTHVFLWCDHMMGYVLPARSLPEPLTTDTLAARLRIFLTAGANAPGATLDAAEPAAASLPDESTTGIASAAGPTPAPNVTPSVRRELATLARALFLLPIDAASIAGRDLTIFVATLILFVIWIPLDLLVFPGNLEFTWYALPGLAWIATGVLGLAWILSRLSLPPVAFRRTLLLAIGSIPIAIAASTIDALIDDQWVFVLIAVTAAWSLLYFKRALRAMTPFLQTRALATAAIACFTFVLVGNELYMSPSFWQPAEEESEPDDDSSTSDPHAWEHMEDLQFGQQARIDDELDRISKLPHAAHSMYFVGFAGYGEQRLFSEEISLAEKRVGERYGVGGRSILLVNDQRNTEQRPLASEPALRYTLEGLGEMMGPDDVLFLALSSHGSEDGSISVSNVGRAPAELSANALADMLKDAKIPWKVIVISACYAGGFIDALRDEHTIVLAAAAQDRTSFGCADDRDLTYFGEAFYRDSLPHATGLRAAFDAARQAIARREKQEQVEASDPQAYYGKQMEAKLATLERR